VVDTISAAGSGYDSVMLNPFEKWSGMITKIARVYSLKEFKCYFLETNRRRLLDRLLLPDASSLAAAKRSDELPHFLEKE
jgi:hypothetical protein